MELLERTHAGDTASVNALLAKGTDPNAVDGGGVTALMIACDRGVYMHIHALIVAIACTSNYAVCHYAVAIQSSVVIDCAGKVCYSSCSIAHFSARCAAAQRMLLMHAM
jgi:Ankyrin repeats (many copies)